MDTSSFGKTKKSSQRWAFYHEYRKFINAIYSFYCLVKFYCGLYCSLDLPYGWERRYDDGGNPYYVE